MSFLRSVASIGSYNYEYSYMKSVVSVRPCRYVCAVRVFIHSIQVFLQVSAHGPPLIRPRPLIHQFLGQLPTISHWTSCTRPAPPMT